MQTHAKTQENKASAHSRVLVKSNRAQPVRPQLQPGLIQRAATLGKRDDAFEREADSVAARVANQTNAPEAVPVAMPAPEGVVQRLSDSDSDTERPGEYLIQPLREGASVGDPTPRPGFFKRLFGVRLGGRALPDPVRSEMEAQIGEPFDDVRIHTGPQADQLAHEIGAKAFTIGRDVVFADGLFQPDSHSGRHLIAHELTHVVQQRGPASGGAVAQSAPASVQRSLDEYLPDVPSIGSIVMGLVRDYAPRLAPILDKGPFDWLSEQLGGVFGGVVDKVAALNPGQYVDSLIETFGDMVTTASEIVGALVAGDCGPMMAALGRMKAMVLEIAGNAWDKVSAFFTPVGDFFADLWGSISATGGAAIEWIKDFAGDVWETIEGIGSYIWDKTAKIREYGLGAWEWLSEKLFGPSDAASGDSPQGIVGWFSDQALDAWGWVKSRTRPVWEPVNEAIETIQELVPPDFVAEMGEKLTSFADDVESTAEDLDQGNSVAENREALNSVLPSLDGLIETVRAVIVGAGTFLSRTIGIVSAKVTTFMTKLRANAVVSWLAGALAWLVTAIDSVSGWASDKVAKLFEWYVKAFDFLSPFVKQLIAIVQKVIDVAIDVLTLPQMLLTEAWNLIPECIREPIKEFVIQTVLGQIPIFKQLANLGNLWEKVQETALQILRSIFVDLDIAKAAWTFFREMLALIGLPAKLVVAILAKSARAYGMILTNPIGFLINTLKAMKEGFQLFFDNILTHLLAGVVGWLSGAVASAGLTFPSEFTLQAVLDFVLELLDITVERVLERLERKIGKEKVDKIRKALEFAQGVWEFVRVVIEEGVGGLWRFVQDKLSNLWTMVLQSTVGWIVEKIITEATIKILSFLDPSGIMAVINSCIAIYRAIETFVEQLKAMLEIVSKVLDGVIGIANGAIDVAAGFLERALASSLPVAIAFLADQVGLGGLADKIKEFVEAVREKVNEAIDFLIEKAIQMGQGFLQLVESGVAMARSGVERLREWWRARTEFRNSAGESHSISIDGQGSNAQVYLRSTPVKYADFLDPESKFVLDTAAKRTAYTNAVTTSDELDRAIADAASAPVAVNPNAQTPTAADNGPKIQELINKLGGFTAVFMPGSAAATEPSTPPVYGAKHASKYGTSATILRLTNTIPTTGSDASARSDEWSTLVGRGYSEGSSASYYVRGHLLNQKLGGPGQKWENLTTLTQTANNLGEDSHEKNFEAKVKRAVLTDTPPRAVNFVCAVNYGRSPRTSQALDFEHQRTSHAQSLNKDNAEAIARIIRAEVNVPLSMDCSAHEIDSDGKATRTLVEYRVPNDIQDSDTDYHLKDGSPPLPELEINKPDIRDDLLKVDGIGQRTYDKFIAAKLARGSTRITTNNILDGLSVDGTTVFSKTQRDKLRSTYRLSFR